MPPTPHDPTRPPSRPATLAAAGLLGVAALLAYWNSLSVPFIFDDVPAIAENPALRSWRHALAIDQGGLTTSGRPLLSLSFALNHAIGGTGVRGYHVVNMLIHTLAALTLLGVVRRTLLLPALAGRFGAVALPAALGASAWWLLHPLQTESVTYVVQRAESLMGLWYLLTLYAFVRWAGVADEVTRRAVPSPRPPHRSRWFALAVSACAAGMATKEVMATAPLVVLLFDRAFVSGSLREAWRRHGRLHGALALSWLILAGLVLGAGSRGGTMALGASGAWWAYPLTQCEAIARYLGLALWPHPLVLDYGTFWVSDAADILPAASVVAVLVAGTLWALWRRPRAGFLGAWFLGILAPTSLAPGTIQMIVEHRVYLSSAAVVVALALAGHTVLGRRAWPALALLVIACGLLTARRNTDYRSALALWHDTVAKRPANALAHTNLGRALQDAGRLPAAIAHYERARRLGPDAPENLNNLGDALRATGRAAEAVPLFEQALALRPRFPEALNNLGVTLRQLNRIDAAIERYRRALELRPEYAEARNNLGSALQASGRADAAIAEIERALRARPGFVEAHSNLAVALRHTGRPDRAIEHFRRALQLEPQRAEIHFNLALLLLELGRGAEAREHYVEARRLRPDVPELRF